MKTKKEIKVTIKKSPLKQGADTKPAPKTMGSRIKEAVGAKKAEAAAKKATESKAPSGEGTKPAPKGFGGKIVEAAKARKAAASAPASNMTSAPATSPVQMKKKKC